MKKFTQKAALAAIILSCGFVTNTEPTAQPSRTIRPEVAAERAWQVPSAAEATPGPKRIAALSDLRASR